MSKKIWGLFVCLLLLSTAVSCGERTPPATNTNQGISATQTEPIRRPLASDAGWKAIAGQGVTLSLPENYEGGNPSTEINKIGERLKALAPDYSEKIQALKRNPDAITLIAFDPQSAQSGVLTNVSIIRQDATDEITVEQYLKTANEQLTPQYKVVEQKLVSLNQEQVGRMVAESTAAKTPIKQLFYVVQQGNTVWLVTYSTTTAEFAKRLPNFEKSIRTLAFPT